LDLLSVRLVLANSVGPVAWEILETIVELRQLKIEANWYNILEKLGAAPSVSGLTMFDIRESLVRANLIARYEDEYQLTSSEMELVIATSKRLKKRQKPG
jgi:hypothetical protein